MCGGGEDGRFAPGANGIAVVSFFVCRSVFVRLLWSVVTCEWSGFRRLEGVDDSVAGRWRKPFLTAAAPASLGNAAIATPSEISCDDERRPWRRPFVSAAVPELPALRISFPEKLSTKRRESRNDTRGKKKSPSFSYRNNVGHMCALQRQGVQIQVPEMHDPIVRVFSE